MSTQSSVDLVHAFWDEVWNAHDADAVDRFVVDDFVIVNAGQEIVGRLNFKNWVRDFLAKVTDLHLEVTESFQNADGSRVASRWLLTGKDNGVLGGEADQRDIAITGTAVWAIREDGKLLTNWVERSQPVWSVRDRAA